MGKRFIVLVFLFGLILPTQFVAALTTVESPPPATAPELIITSIAGNGLLGTTAMVEVFNQADDPVNTNGLLVSITLDNCAGHIAQETFPAGWILPKRYVSLSVSNVTTSCPAAKIAAVKLLQDSKELQSIAIPVASTFPAGNAVAQHKQRGNSLSSTRTLTGVFLTDYKSAPIDTAFYNDPLYVPPASSAGLQILEVLPHSKDCSPLENHATCGDYVKLYNPTTQPIDLAKYRLRTGYKGQNESITNTFTWGQEIDPGVDEVILPPHTYLMLTARNDADTISITDSGGYVWIEDAYGVKIYDPVVSYPDASSETKVGWAWAYDGAAWRWTSSPQPAAANSFPPQSSETVDLANSALEPCPAGKYRNPATNRCKSIELSTSTLVDCGPDKVRNPETNRCRSVLTASTALTPCKPGQERNPDTNRCRSVLAASTTLAPCDEGEERNSETNRCRKLTAPANTAASAAAKQDTSKRKINYAIIGAIATFAIGYGAYEYRRDIQNALIRFKSRIFANASK